MSYNKLQELADKFAHETVYFDKDAEFTQQRLRMKEFYLSFYRRLRGLVGELEGDVRIMKERNFDPKMLKLMIKSYRELLEILKTSDPEKPYHMGEKFVNYVLGRPTAAILDNLDFLIQHHLKNSKIDTMTGNLVGHPNINTFNQLKALAEHIKNFMAENPPIPIPGSDFPPAMPARPAIIAPEAHTPASPLEETKPGSPSAKMK